MKPPRTNIKGACTIVFALAEVWVMRLEKLPLVVVLLVGCLALGLVLVVLGCDVFGEGEFVFEDELDWCVLDTLLCALPQAN